MAKAGGGKKDGTAKTICRALHLCCGCLKSKGRNKKNVSYDIFLEAIIYGLIHEATLPEGLETVLLSSLHALYPHCIHGDVFDAIIKELCLDATLTLGGLDGYTTDEVTLDSALKRCLGPKSFILEDKLWANKETLQQLVSTMQASLVNIGTTTTTRTATASTR